ncbi:apolipoprotein N-acyltransferase [Acuticoccus kandeliae]|uniref:apolipoprotein N-acyltransferase n=1 Tax=Acuticoccus kandeliae TaxID=2073160 RepID=UPI000D3E35D5|nr:apolipoprotein N-acyltransferase [Acuticoccus kandeliae]
MSLPERTGPAGRSATSTSTAGGAFASRWSRVATAFAAGIILGFSLPPYDFFPAVFAYSALLVVLMAGEARVRRRMAERALLGGVFGFGYHLMGLWWVGAAFLVDADTFGALLPLGVIGLPLMLAPFYALAAMLVGLAPRTVAWQAVALALAISATDVLRGLILSGFPWNAAGLAFSDFEILRQNAAFIGMDGLAVPAVLIGCAPALFFTRGSRWLLMPVGAMLAIMLIAGLARLNSAPVESANAPRIRIVQPAVPQADKWAAEHRTEIWQRLLDLSAPEGAGVADVVIWPETALPFLYRVPSLEADEISEAMQWTATLVTGAVELVETETGRRATNSIFVIGPDGQLRGRYDKVHLVPFGEFLPFAGLMDRLGFRKIVEGTSQFLAGTERAPLTIPGLPPALPLICYEIIFPDVGRTEGIGWIVNVTNDAWFGDTPGPRQHLRQAQMRAIEQGVPVVRAANNGISAVIDTQGHLVGSLALDEIGFLDARLPPVRASLYPTLGNGVLFGLWILGLAALFIARRMKKA